MSEIQRINVFLSLFLWGFLIEIITLLNERKNYLGCEIIIKIKHWIDI